MDPLRAMLAPRAHTQLLPDRVDLEHTALQVLGSDPVPTISTSEEVFAALRARGHHNVTHCSTGMGVSQFIWIDRDSGVLHAVSDPRKDGRPAAYS